MFPRRSHLDNKKKDVFIDKLHSIPEALTTSIVRETMKVRMSNTVSSMMLMITRKRDNFFPVPLNQIKVSIVQGIKEETGGGTERRM